MTVEHQPPREYNPRSKVENLCVELALRGNRFRAFGACAIDKHGGSISALTSAMAAPRVAKPLLVKDDVILVHKEDIRPDFCAVNDSSLSSGCSTIA